MGRRKGLIVVDTESSLAELAAVAAGGIAVETV